MLFYTLTDTFQRDQVIDLFESAIWTERFVEAGDFQIKLPADKQLIEALDAGRFIELEGSSETMYVESRLIEDGYMTITGKSIEVFFNERYTPPPRIAGLEQWYFQGFPGVIIGVMVSKMLQPGVISADGPLFGELDKIPNFVVGDLDASGVSVYEGVNYITPLYDAILEIAKKYKVGMSVNLSRADAFGYELKFTTFRGKDRTRGQVENDPIIFSPETDTMTKVKELSSNAGAKTVAHVRGPAQSGGGSANWPSQTVYAPGADSTQLGFDRRLLIIDGQAPAGQQTTASMAAALIQQGKDALANNNFTKMIDGEVIPQPGYVYGKHYFLGDLIELVGQSGIPQKANITEFIRSQDSTGERAYPTVSVVDE